MGVEGIYTAHPPTDGDSPSPSPRCNAPSSHGEICGATLASDGRCPRWDVKGVGMLGQWGGAKVYHKRLLASVNVRTSCSGEVSQRQAGRRFLEVAYRCNSGFLTRITYITMPYKTVIRLLGVARKLANGFPARLLVLQRQFREGCGVMPAWRRGAWHGSVWPVRYCPAYPQATAATRLARTVPGAAFPAPPGRPAAS